MILLVPDDAAGKSAGTRTGKGAPAGVPAGYGCDTGTGSVDVPETAAGGKCEIRTATGDIKIKTEK